MSALNDRLGGILRERVTELAPSITDAHPLEWAKIAGDLVNESWGRSANDVEHSDVTLIVRVHVEVIDGEGITYGSADFEEPVYWTPDEGSGEQIRDMAAGLAQQAGDVLDGRARRAGRVD